MVASIPPAPGPDELMAELRAARRDLARAAQATRMAKAQAEVEGLMQAARLAQAAGDAARAEALLSEAGRSLVQARGESGRPQLDVKA